MLRLYSRMTLMPSRSFFKRLITRSIFSSMEKNSCLGSWSLEKATRFLVRFFPLRVCSYISSRVFFVLASLQSRRESSVLPMIMPRTLLKSWAIFPAIRPTSAIFSRSSAIFWFSILSSSFFLRSEISRKIPTIFSGRPSESFMSSMFREQRDRVPSLSIKSVS